MDLERSISIIVDMAERILDLEERVGWLENQIDPNR